MKSFEDFKNDLGERESSNNYHCENTLGFLGRWQMGKPRLWDLGYSIGGWHPVNGATRCIISKEDFLNDSELQDNIFYIHINDLANRIEKKYPPEIIEKYSLSGLVAGAHLKGLGGVKDFLQGNDNQDAYGTKISEYITKFKDYVLV